MPNPTSGNSGKSFSPGTECIARYDFKGISEKDLPFKKGDIIEILQSTRDPNWYNAKKVSDGRTGTIPINYVQQRRALHLHEMPWFFGKITREKAEELLTPREVGLFLVRESTNFPGDYTLCVVSPQNNKKVEHYRVISTNDNRVTVDEDAFFPNLIELIKHYERDADGLCTMLKKPLKKKTEMVLQSAIFKESFQKEGWAVPIEDVEFKELIGKGEFGDVYKGVWAKKTVAIKKLRDDSKTAQSLLAEASVMTTLQHKNLVVLVAISFQGDSILILTEYCEKGVLVEYLRTRGRAVITLEEQKGFAIDVCNGMRYLEEKNIIHRDLAARNVLLSDELCAKVSDFGLAKDVEQELASGKFPVKWTAPEAIEQKIFSTKSDVWSFGILLWEIFSFGRNPYPRVPLDELLTKIKSNYRMECPEKCPPFVYQLMLKCWDADPSRRPSFKQLHNELFNPDRETKL
ncbi:tyrosine-protein kinase CSK isoform X1 [Hydra vulgaris]|nr:tyrosine-protein kinase CSK [Hydra vulgaris]